MLSRRAWIVFLAAGALLLGVYLFVPPLEGSGPLMNVLGLAPVLAILAGIRLHEPRARAAWSCFAIGFTLFWLGDLYTYSYPLLLDRDVPFPSLGDAAYLLVYPALIAGLVVLERRRTRGSDRGSAIDAAIMTVGLALPSWIWLMVPYLHDDTLSTVGRFVSVAYPLADVLLLAVAVRLALDGGQRRPAFHLMCASIICLLVTDFVYGLMILHGTYDHQLWLDAGWIGFYLLWGAAALHPSMSDIDEPAVKRGEGLTRFRLALLTGASLIAPTMGMVHDLSVGDYDFAVVRAASITLFGLVILRMAGLMRQQERSLERERMLSASGTDLVAAAGRDEIDQVALSAARALAGPDLMTLVRSAGSDAALDAALLEAARDGEVVRLRVDALAALGLPGDHNRALVLDLAPPHRERRLLVAAGRTAPPEAIRASLRALASQVALALERASLTEEIHRRRGEARFGSLVRHASDLITVIGPDGTISYQSPSVERLLGYVPSEVTGRPFAELVHDSDGGRVREMLADVESVAGDQPHVVQCTLVHRDGTPQQFEVNCTNLVDDEHVGGIVLNCRDVSERQAFEEQLTHQAFHDPVTGLANRALFAERVRHAIARNRREHRGIAVVFLDLDDFKTINDSLGHAAGDEVLSVVAKRLATSVRASDTAARFGGDEFALLLEDIDDVQQAADTAERVLESLAMPLRVAHKELSLRCSIGISVVEEDTPAGAEELIRDADAAMYSREARRQGQLPHVRARDARGRPRPARAPHRPAARDRHRAARAPLPAARAARGRQRLRRRGAAALAPPRARADPAGAVHPARRGNRADHPDRPLGPARGLPPWAPGAGGRARDERNLSEKQLSTATSSPTQRRAVGGRYRARALMLEITESGADGRHRVDVRRLDELEGARRAAGARRLRHGLLVAQLPAPLPGRRAQDRPLFQKKKK